MNKKSKHSSSNLPSSNPSRLSSYDLSKTVKTLINNQKSRSQELSSLRHRRRELLRLHEQRLSDFESKYLLQSEELSSKLDELKASIAEEQHSAKSLSHPSKNPKSVLKQLSSEIHSLKTLSKNLSNEYKTEKVKNSNIHDEISVIRSERASNTNSLKTVREEVENARKRRICLESEREGVNYLFEKSASKLKEVSASYTSLSYNSQNSLSHNKLKKIKEDLEERYGENRLQKERNKFFYKFEKKLSEVLHSSAEKLRENEKELNNRLEATKKSISKLKDQMEVLESAKAESALECEKENNRMNELENEFRSIEQVRKGNKFEKRDAQERVKMALHNGRQLLQEYFSLTSQIEGLNREKLEILETIQNTKNLLKEENNYRENVNESGFNSEFVGETEGEESAFEDNLLEESLFPELVEDLERKNLKIEGWGFGRRIQIQNMGGNSITVYEGTRIFSRKGKKEFIIGERFSLGPGEYCLVRRGDWGYEGEDKEAKVVFEWNEDSLSDYAIDEILLSFKGEVVSRSMLINDNYYDMIINGGRSKKVKEVKDQSRMDNSCVMF